MLTIGDAARILQCSKSTVRERIRNQGLPTVRLGDSPKAPIRIRRADLDRWVDDRDGLKKLQGRARLARPLLALSRRERLARFAQPKPVVRRRKADQPQEPAKQ